MKIRNLLFALLILLASCHSAKDLQPGDTFKLTDWSFSIHDFYVVKVTDKGVLCNSTNGHVTNLFFSFNDLNKSNCYEYIGK